MARDYCNGKRSFGARWHGWILAAVWAGAVTAQCAAQSRPEVIAGFDTDVRVHAPIGGAIDGTYAGTFRLDVDTRTGWRLDLYGRLNEKPFRAAPAAADLLIQQASLEREWRGQRLQVGIVRLPFGIYDYRETYASGLIDYPIARGDYGMNSVDWGVPGARWSGGGPKLQVDAAAFAGRSSGTWGNLNDVGGEAARIQTYSRGLILGASYWNGYLGMPAFGSTGTAWTSVGIAGLDIRYTRPHLLLRGEALAGTLGGKRMEGWYLDFYYHLPRYQRTTFVARAEAFRPTSSMPYGRQITLGIRYTAAPDWTLALNWKRNNFDRAYPYGWTAYSGRGGVLFFQVYHKATL